ncbi:DUF6443 domain-containing protein [Winogradskyella sp.]|uniref:DUF6443 domain-containing protein n=1 Tax=Winogradskyella sp. TaxID=1883156 RepID=UPI003BA9B76C
MKRTVFMLCQIVFMTLASILVAQELPNIVPPSPEASSLGKFSEVPISHYTGVPNISVPIASYSVGGRTFPVGISYHSRGIQVEEIASRIGLGWALNAGGQITRQQRDKPDDSNYGIFGNAFRNGFTDPTHFENPSAYDQLCTYLNGIITPEFDRHPDIFNIQAGGLSTKFIFDFLGDDKPLLQKYDDIIVNEVRQGVNGKIVAFTVVDQSGYKYWFGISKDGLRTARDEDQTQTDYRFFPDQSYEQNGHQAQISQVFNTWHLMDIESPNGDMASFYYDMEETYLFRRSFDEFRVGHETDPILPSPELSSYINHSSLVRTHQYQLREIRYNYSGASYESIVFESTDPRSDLKTNAWPSNAKELDAIKTYNRNGVLIKTHQLTQSYMNSTDTGNYHSLFVSLDNSSSKRLVLDAITEIGRDGSAKPPHAFTYNPQTLPNRFSNSQDLWGYYNGADNGQYLSFTEGLRQIDTIRAQAGMLEKITYPTGGSTRFTYEHNRGIKGNEYDGIWFPRVNPITYRSEGLSSISGNTYYNGDAYVREFDVGVVSQLVTFTTNLPNNQNTECADPGAPSCEFSMLLERITGDGVVAETFILNGGTQQFFLSPSRYRLTVNPDDNNWQLPPYGQGVDPAQYTFVVSLTWEEQVTAESEIFYTSGKRIKMIEYLDGDDTVVSKKEYSYRTENGNESGIVLGIPNFLPKHPIFGPNGGLLPGPASPGGIFKTYQGNTTGYSRVTEYYGEASRNIGKTVYNFTNIKDSGDHLSFPSTPPTDNEWLRGMPYKIAHYKNDGNNDYKKVKENRSQYSYGGIIFNEDIYAQNLLPADFIYTPQSLRKDCGTYPDPSLNIYYEKTDTHFRIPFIHVYAVDLTPNIVDPPTYQYKIYHYTGGTVDRWFSSEILYDDNENETLVTEARTGYNYSNHYQPVKVTTVTSDGLPMIETMSYPHDLVGSLPTQAENDIAQDLIDQNRFVPLETRTYKDLNNDGLPGFGITDELLSTTKTQYDWFNTGTILEPKTVLTSKANDPLEARIHFELYNSTGDILQVSKTDGVSIVYIWGYDQTLPVAKIENATYTAITALSSFSGGILLPGALSPAQEAELRGLPNAIVTTYTYEEGVGLKTATDARGHDITYNYDTFNRLVNIVDEDGYLVSENEYNYKLSSGTQNYIKNTTYLVETTDGINHAITGNPLTDDDKVENITYFDGLARGLQNIIKQAGGQKQDIVTSMGYDEYGRQLREYLPYSRTISSLDFDINLLPDANGNISALNAQYMAKYADDLTGTVNPYSEKVQEASPLGRVLEQAAPGSDWAVGNGHTIMFEYLTNTYDPNNPANPNNDNVIHFDVQHPTESNVLNTEKTTLVYVEHYPANELYKTVTKDENWTSGRDHTAEEFTNKQGQVVLKRAFNNNQAHDTYYVYDDFGNLTYVLPPEASDDILMQDVAGRVASLTNYSWVDLANVDSEFAEEYSRRLQDYENADILNADIENAYGGQGGFTVTTLEGSEEVTLSINFSATDALELKSGELVSLDAYGNHSDTELGRITGPGYRYTFYITKNAIYISGSGRLNGINEVFNSNTTLAYEYSYLWPNFVDINRDFAVAHESEVLAHAKDTEQDPLNVYLENSYGGRGGLNLTVDENDNMVLSFNISSTTGLSLREGVAVSLDAKRRFTDRYLGRLSAPGYSYDLELKDNSIVVTGTGSGVSYGGTLFPNPPDQDDPIIRTEVIEGLCYIYHYDYRNRLIEKKIPGKGWEYIVYDKLDRPLLTQDARQRLNNEWLFTKYDVLGRATYTGQYGYAPLGSEDNSGRLELQTTANSQTLLYETKTVSAQTINGSTVHYTNDSFPDATDLDLLTITYYDDYSNTHLDTTELIKQSGDMVYDEAIDTNAKLLTTASNIRVLGTDDWITSVSYYDADDMPIYIASKNAYLNTSDVVITDYDFVGKVITTESTHTKDSNTPIVIEDSYSYDHAQRLRTQTQTINGSEAEQIVKNNYDEYGQLANKDVGGAMGGNGLQTVDYNYNIRGWLKSVNDGLTNGTDLFGYRLNYNITEQVGATALFNGNIAEMYWTNKVVDGSTQSQAYDYKYDALNRLTAANYHLLNSGATNDYSLNNVAYDKNGNITVLKRTGLVEAVDGTVYFDIIDDLSYTYDTYSNTLLMVHDNAVDKGFKDDNDPNNTEDYLYDINGSLKKDGNKSILDITYNHLNLPMVVTIDNGTANGTISYTYDAMGIKLSKRIVEYPTATTRTTKTTDYVGAYIYEKTGGYSFDGQFWQGAEVDRGIRLITTLEGYMQPDHTGNGFDYVYNLTDHLGNIRVTYLDKNQNNANAVDLEIVELNSYYPYGMAMEYENNVVSSYTNSMARKFKYNGIEHEESLGLDLYEMDVRHYDAAIARWTGIDPVTHHSMSTYLAFDGNPIYWADPSGADSESDWESTVAAWNAEYEAWENGASLRDVWGSGNISSRNSSSNSKVSDNGSTWKATANDDGSVSYLAQEGATVQSFVDQYGVTYKQAKELLNGNEHNIQAGVTSVSGQDVYDMNPYDLDEKSEVLKLQNSRNKQANLDQIAFAFRYDVSPEHKFIITDYFSIAKNAPSSATIEVSGTLNINGSSIKVWGEFRIISERNASFFGCKTGGCYSVPYAYATRGNTLVNTGDRGNQYASYRITSYLYFDGKRGNTKGYKENWYHALVTNRKDGETLANYLERK